MFYLFFQMYKPCNLCSGMPTDSGNKINTEILHSLLLCEKKETLKLSEIVGLCVWGKREGIKYLNYKGLT